MYPLYLTTFYKPTKKTFEIFCFHSSSITIEPLVTFIFINYFLPLLIYWMAAILALHDRCVVVCMCEHVCVCVRVWLSSQLISELKDGHRTTEFHSQLTVSVTVIPMRAITCFTVRLGCMWPHCHRVLCQLRLLDYARNNS